MTSSGSCGKLMFVDLGRGCEPEMALGRIEDEKLWRYLREIKSNAKRWNAKRNVIWVWLVWGDETMDSCWLQNERLYRLACDCVASLAGEKNTGHMTSMSCWLIIFVIICIQVRNLATS